MARSTFYIVTDDYNLIEQAKNFCQNFGVNYEVYSPEDWETKQKNQSSLSSGAQVVQGGATIIPFPGTAPVNNKVQTINELESVAIEKAIFEFNGNLTEAAKALGIGRATLYRKVKQYNINPSIARKKKIAA